MSVELNRLFFALWPDDRVRAACSDAVRDLKLRMQGSGRWTPAERYHMTLFFLGSAVTPEQEAAARQAADQVRVAPFNLNLDYAGCFKRRQMPWWLGAREVAPGLQALLDALHDGLLAARVLPDRERFVPHVTILREGGRPLPDTAIRPIPWTVSDFVLVRSRMDRQPLEYEIAARWPLRAPEAPPPAAGQLKLWET